MSTALPGGPHRRWPPVPCTFARGGPPALLMEVVLSKSMRSGGTCVYVSDVEPSKAWPISK